MIHHPALELLKAEYGSLQFEPLRITALLENQVTWYEPLHFDGLLAAAVVIKALVGGKLEPTAECYDISLPLQCMWRHPQTNVPVWAATDFAPVGDSANDIRYWHKRGPKEGTLYRQDKHGTKPINIRTGQGTYKEYRIPTPMLVTDAIYATCIGSQTAIADLLPCLGGNIGKKRAHGCGSVKEWLIEPISSFSFQDENGVLLRPIPIQMVPEVVLVDMILCGYSPPYWNGVPDAQELCYPSGAIIEEKIWRK